MAISAFQALRAHAIRCTMSRAVVRVTGEAPLSFLHATLTQDVQGLRPGEGALAAYLDDKGRILAEVRVLAMHDGSVLLDAEDAARDALMTRLARIAPLSGCTLEDESLSWRYTAVRGPAAGADLGLPDDEHAHIAADGDLAIRVVWGGPGIDILSRGEPAVDANDVDLASLEAARIAAGRTRFGIDVTPDLILNETPLLTRAVSFTKGCYPGQETVAKVRNLGRVRKLLVGLDGDAPMRAGDAVLYDGADVGAIRSAGETDAGWSAIALVRAEAAERDALVVGPDPVRVRPL